MGKPKQCTKCDRTRENHVGTYMGRRCPLPPLQPVGDSGQHLSENPVSEIPCQDKNAPPDLELEVIDPSWAKQERQLQEKINQIKAHKQRQANQAAHTQRMQTLLQQLEQLEKDSPMTSVPKTSVPFQDTTIPIANASSAWNIPPFPASSFQLVPPEWASLAALHPSANTQVHQITSSSPATTVATPATASTPGQQGKQKPYFPCIEQNIHRPGVAEVQFNTLSFPEVSLAVTRILGSHIPPSHIKQGLLHLFTTVASKAVRYKWASVRAFMQVALKEIKKGTQYTWCSDLSELSDDMLKDNDLLPHTASYPNEYDVTASNICVQWNFSQCPRMTNCHLYHYCNDCFVESNKLETHKALECAEIQLSNNTELESFVPAGFQ